MSVLGVFVRWNARFRMRSALARLTDAERRDMGLSRADIADEIAKPLWRG
ncbi:MAG: DUF1127 domain-containing protein [Paracoccaceae bacterium]